MLFYVIWNCVDFIIQTKSDIINTFSIAIRTHIDSPYQSLQENDQSENAEHFK